MVNFIQNILKYLLLNESNDFERKSEVLFRMRGFSYLKKKGDLRKILELKKELTITKIRSIANEKKWILNFFFGQIDNPELLVRQYLLMRFGYFNFNRSVFFNLGKKTKFLHPIPPDWFFLINKYNLNLNKLGSSIWFRINVFFNFFISIFFFITFLFQSLFFKKNTFSCNHVIFYNILSKYCFPSEQNNQKYTLIKWYLDLKQTKKINIKKIFHNKNLKKYKYKDILIENYKHIFPRLSFKNYILFFIESIFIIIFSFFLIFLDKWFYALMLKDILLNNYYRKINKKLIAKQYLFDNSNFVYRPLWTHYAEKKGSEIICYFYSTNCMEIEENKKHSSIGWGYRAMDWPIYYVWDHYQKKFIEEISNKNKTIVECGPIYFLDKKFNIIKNIKKQITIFDIQPRRSSVICSRVEPIYYYNDRNMIKFLDDIVNLAIKKKYNILLKQKRKYNYVVSKKYINYVEKLSLKNNIKIVDQNISPIKLIDASNASLSIPFTSSSLYSSIMSKKTAYYDPISIINKDNIAAHGIEVINGKNELDLWFDQI